MEMNTRFLVLISVLGLSVLVSCEDSKYSLVTLSQVHTGRSLQSLLTVYYSSPQDVQFVIKKKGSDTVLLTETKSVSGDGTPDDIEIDIPSNWESGEYMLNAFNDVFNASVDFKVAPVPYAILIQTDKPIYKPSQTVNIRVAIIDDNLIPRNETVDVIVEDAEGNKIQQWKRQQAQMGLLQFSLPLSDRPPLGDWTITVTGEETAKEKTVKIDEYVLPRFEVTVELPSYILKRADSLACTVRAQYTYGEDVSGDLSITFHSTNNLTKKGIKIDGVTVVILDQDDIHTIGLAYGVVTAEASVFEPLSGKTLSGSGSTKIAVSDYEVTFSDFNSKIYSPGQEYIAYYGVARPDGQKIKGESNTLEVTLTASNYDRPFTPVTVTAAVPDSGTVAITITMPSSDYYSVTLSADLILENGDRITGVSVDDFDEFQTQMDNVFLQMSSDITGVPKVGDVASVTVSSSQQTGPFNYMVTSGGRIVLFGTGTFSSGTASFSLTITQQFTPQAYLVVSGVVGGELLADSMTFNVDGSFQNAVTVEFTDTDGTAIAETKPGTDIKVKVGTEAGSTVGLLSVDKSVLLLAGGNDISQTQIIVELMSLVETESACDDDDDDSGPIFFCWFPTFGGKSSEDIFSLAGTVVATDAALQECYSDYWQDFVPLAFAPERHYDYDAGPSLGTDVPSSQADAPQRRQFFPETWLWDLVVSDDGSLVLDETAPDTITTWVTTALSMHPTSGIAVTAEATELTVKLPFFISAILPYSAVKGEELELKIIVNNYGDADDSCTVTVEGSDQYEAKQSENDLYMPGTDLELTSVSVAKGGSAVVALWLKPLVIDTIQFSASAVCTSAASDAFQKDLLVKPAGYPQERCESKFVQIEANEADVSKTFNIYIDGEYVEGSKRVQVQVTGDVMGPSIEGLDSLVQMPYGCGEQNMISFTPNIFVRAYLEHIGDLDLDIEQKTTLYMQTGYQRELTYKHPDGSFSAFGSSDPSGSTWLTAFVMKCFRQASHLIEIDLTVLEKSLSWLNDQKSEATPGMFNEPGRVIHSEMQGGSSGGITLTAFVVIAMLEDVSGSDLTSRISSLSSTVSYLENSLSIVESNAYQLSIITYALQLSQSGQTDEFLAKLESLQHSEGGLVWWSETKEDTDETEQYSRYSAGPSAVEMTSYALLIYIDRNDISKAKPIAMWLTETRGSGGGYFSTQDTVLGLQSLAAYAKLVVSDSTNLLVEFETSTALQYNHTITADNAIITKKHSFKPADNIDQVTVSISGEGSTIVTACTGYNVRTMPKKPTTVVTTETSKSDGDSGKINLNACISYIGEGDSGMGLTQVMLPTGYSAAVEDAVHKSGDLARMEATSNGLAVYWNAITPEQSCVDVTLVRDTLVKEVQDSYVMGSQYYKTESGSRAFYNPQSAQVVVEPPKPSGSASTVSAMISLMMVELAALLL